MDENVVTSHSDRPEIMDTMGRQSSLAPLQVAQIDVQGGNKFVPSQDILPTIPLKIIKQKTLVPRTPLSLQGYLRIQKTPERSTGITSSTSQLKPLHQIQGSSALDDRQNMMKCAVFFKKLIQNCQRTNCTQSEQKELHSEHFVAIKELISAAIFNEISVEDFIYGLQDLLKLKTQTQLAPFLRKTLPGLRAAITSGEVVIEDIIKFPGSSVAITLHDPQNSGLNPSVQCNPVILQDNKSAQDLASFQSMPELSTSLSQNFTQHHLKIHESGIPTQADENVIHVRRFQDAALDSAVLKTSELLKKITKRMNETCYVEEEVLTLISDAFEYRLREMLGELTVLAEHRVDPLRLNSSYGIVDETRRQLYFMQNIDRQKCDSRKYVGVDIKRMESEQSTKYEMTTGVIKFDSLDDIQIKTSLPSRCSSIRLSQTDRSSSGISSASHSPVTNKCPAPTSPIVKLCSNSSISEVIENPTNYNNSTPHGNSCYLTSSPSPSRTFCTGVLTLQDELCIDLQKKALTDVTSTKKNMVRTCVNYLQSKWRSLPVTMLPVKPGVDQKPLSPKSQQDENINQRHNDQTSSGRTLPTCSLASNQPAATEAHPTFSCAVTTVIDVKPEFMYGPRSNNSHVSGSNGTNALLAFL
uniref:TAFH domain-containing protein n=1 Tax=Heterorhabditis bacteriophora TaxID=37862 RepID=A0A1I7XHL0_HETBA